MNSMAKSSFESELLATTDLARAALLEVTDSSSVGDCTGHEVLEDGVGNLYFACSLRGYPGWRWTATLAKVSATDPMTVLEVELLPGDGALLPPDWVPWSVRLAQYQESQAQIEAELAAAALADDEDADDDDDLEDDLEDDILVNDFSDFDDEINGVDIDSLSDDDDDDDDEAERFAEVDDDDDELDDDLLEIDDDVNDQGAVADEDDR